MVQLGVRVHDFVLLQHQRNPFFNSFRLLCVQHHESVESTSEDLGHVDLVQRVELHELKDHIVFLLFLSLVLTHREWQAQLALSCSAASEDLAVLGQNERVMPSCCYLLDLLKMSDLRVVELHLVWLVVLPGVSVPQLALLVQSEGEQGQIIAHAHQSVELASRYLPDQLASALLLLVPSLLAASPIRFQVVLEFNLRR